MILVLLSLKDNTNNASRFCGWTLEALDREAAESSTRKSPAHWQMEIDRSRNISMDTNYFKLLVLVVWYLECGITCSRSDLGSLRRKIYSIWWFSHRSITMATMIHSSTLARIALYASLFGTSTRGGQHGRWATVPKEDSDQLQRSEPVTWY